MSVLASSDVTTLAYQSDVQYYVLTSLISLVSFAQYICCGDLKCIFCNVDVFCEFRDSMSP